MKIHTWDKVLEHAVSGLEPKSFNVKMKIKVGDKIWNAYECSVAHRDILCFCEEGTCTFLVDSYGNRTVAELFDWDEA